MPVDGRHAGAGKFYFVFRRYRERPPQDTLSLIDPPRHTTTDPMQVISANILNIDELRTFVHAQLCARENLLEDQFRTREEALIMRGRTCGRQFQLHGPRSIRLGAIWAADQNLIYFYDTQGERYLKVELQTSITDAA